MKQLIALITLFLSQVSVLAQELSFEHLSHDFGLISEADGKVSHDFKFTNTGLSLIHISEPTRH